MLAFFVAVSIYIMVTLLGRVVFLNNFQFIFFVAYGLLAAFVGLFLHGVVEYKHDHPDGQSGSYYYPTRDKVLKTSEERKAQVAEQKRVRDLQARLRKKFKKTSFF